MSDLECKSCGCRVVQKIDSQSVINTGGVRVYLYRCQFCRAAFYHAEDVDQQIIKPVAVYLRTPCPCCGSINTTQKNRGSRKTVSGVKARSHKCNVCQTNFVSHEVLK